MLTYADDGKREDRHVSAYVTAFCDKFLKPDDCALRFLDANRSNVRLQITCFTGTKVQMLT